MATIDLAEQIVSSAGPFWTDREIVVSGEGPEGPLRSHVERPFAMVGSHEKAHVRLNGPRVVRRHLYLHATGRGIYCVNLARGSKVRKPVAGWLHPGQVVQAGDYRLTVEFADGSTMSADPDTDLLFAPLKSVVLPEMRFGIKGRAIGTHLMTRRLAIVGSARHCTFQFTTRSISAEHCVFYRDESRIWLIDLKSAAGTRLNRSPIECEPINDDSQVLLGRLTLRLGFDFKSRNRAVIRPQPAENIAVAQEHSSAGEELTAESDSFPVESSVQPSGDHWHQRLTEQRALLARWRQLLGQRHARVADLDRDLMQSAERLDAIGSATGDSIRAHSSSIQQLVDALESDCETQRASIDSELRRLLGEAGQALDELQAAWGGLRQQHLALQQQQQAWESAQQAASDVILSGHESLRAEREELQRLQAELRAKIEELTAQEENLQRQREAVRLEREQYRVAREKASSTSMPEADEARRKLEEELREELERERSEFDRQRENGELELQQAKQELAENLQELAEQRRVLESVQAQLANDRRELERFHSIDLAQRRLLASLDDLRRKKSVFSRLAKWLGWPFYRHE